MKEESGSFWEIFKTQKTQDGKDEGDNYMPTVNEIRSFPFNKEGLEQVRATKDGKN